ncbi:MAG: TolC family protein [Planctomycetota bacterium]
MGPNYVPINPVVPSSWQNQTNETASFDAPDGTLLTVQTDESIAGTGHGLSSYDCPWWASFLDDNMLRLMELQRTKSPDLHGLRAAVDQAWQQRWVLKRGLYPRIENQFGRNERGGDPFGDQDFDNILRWDFSWELDLFGGVQRSIEAADRNLESQIETWRNANVFFAGEIGLFYTDLRANEARIALQLQDIEFYQFIVQLVEKKLSLGGTSEVDLEEAKAQLERVKALLPGLERQRDNARVEIARVVGAYSHEVDSLIDANLAIPQPTTEIRIPSPEMVLPQRPDIRRQERRVASQVATVAAEFAELYPNVSFPIVLEASDLATGAISDLTIGVAGSVLKRLVNPERERARIREQEALLQREIRTYERTLVTASAEVENAIVDVNSAYDQIAAISKAVESNQVAYEKLVSGYSKGLVDVRDVIRIRTSYFDTRTELIFAQNLLAKSTVQLFKAIGGIDVPPIPAHMVPSDYGVTESDNSSPFLSWLLSLNRDREKTLHTNRNDIRHQNRGLYEITLDGELQRTPDCETEPQRKRRESLPLKILNFDR